MAKFEAVDNSYGFQDRYFTKGDTIDVSNAEVKAMKKEDLAYFKKHFKKAGAVEEAEEKDEAPK